MIEQDPRAGVQAVGFTVVGDLPVGGGLGYRVRAPGPEWGQLVDRGLPRVAKALARARIVKPDGAIYEPYAFEEIKGVDGNAFQGLNRLLKGERDRGLSPEIIDFVRLDLG